MRSRTGWVVRHALGLALAILFILPIYWMIVASLRQPGLAPPRTVEWWPASPQWSNYVEIFRLVPVLTRNDCGTIGNVLDIVQSCIDT